MEYLIGAMVGVAAAAFGQLAGFDRSRNFYPIALIVIASYYELFAVMGGSTTALWLETVVFGAFTVLAVIGFRVSLWLVVVGMIAHGLSDAVHLVFIDNSGVPHWWPAFCMTTDLAMGGYAALRIAGLGPKMAVEAGLLERPRLQGLNRCQKP
jgi:hypothetical protein